MVGTLPVMVVDDDPISVRGISAMLKSDESIEVIVAPNDPDQAIETARKTRPKVILLDYHFAETTGIDLIHQFRSVYPTPKILMLSAFSTPELAYAALGRGAQGFLEKTVTREYLTGACHQALYGGITLSPALCNDVLRQQVKSSKKSSWRFTPREIEVAELLAEGRSNASIANELKLTESAVKKHVSSVMRKTKTGSRFEAALALRHFHFGVSPF